jgi:hypothetical protein
MFMRKEQASRLGRVVATGAGSLALLVSFTARASGQQTNETSGAFWPTVNLFAQLKPSFRMLALAS